MTEVTPEVVMPKVRKTRQKLMVVSDQVVDAYTNGSTIAEISFFFGCSNGTVRNLLIIKGVTMRPQGRKKTIPIASLEDDD